MLPLVAAEDSQHVIFKVYGYTGDLELSEAQMELTILNECASLIIFFTYFSLCTSAFCSFIYKGNCNTLLDASHNRHQQHPVDSNDLQWGLSDSTKVSVVLTGKIVLYEG